MRVMQPVMLRVSLWFSGLGLVGKAVAIFLAGFVAARFLADLGLDHLARSLWDLDLNLGALIATWLIVRFIWRRHTNPSRH